MKTEQHPNSFIAHLKLKELPMILETPELKIMIRNEAEYGARVTW